MRTDSLPHDSCQTTKQTHSLEIAEFFPEVAHERVRKPRLRTDNHAEIRTTALHVLREGAFALQPTEMGAQDGNMIVVTP